MARIMTKEKADLIADIERFPNPHKAWSAFRARVIEVETVHHLLRDRRSPRQRMIDALYDVILNNIL